MPEPSLWCLALVAGQGSADAYAEAMEPYCETISWLDTEVDGIWRVEGYSQIEPDATGLNQAVAAVALAFAEPAPKVTIKPVKPRDWAVENLHSFPPIDAGRYFIHGSHYRHSPPPGRIGIHLNPGRAFGSGDHATTQGCLLALDGLARVRHFGKMLDMGCGSGILAIAMARTWATGRVMAADIDRQAVQVAVENIRRNGVDRRVRTLAGDGYRSGRLSCGRPYDLIVSNILANPLCQMAVDLGNHLKKSEDGGGVAVLSGFLVRDARRVLAAHQAQGLHLVRYYDIKGWRTLMLSRKGYAEV